MAKKVFRTESIIADVKNASTFTDDIKPVLSSSAQNGIQCATDRQTEAIVLKILSLLEQPSIMGQYETAVLELQFLSGCRIGSALAVTSRDVSEIGQVRIPAEKGGLSVIVTPVYSRQIWLHIRKSGLTLSSFLDRFRMYRLYKKFGIYAKVEGNERTSVTHAIRHKVLAGTEGFNITERERANYAGQKDVKSQENYLPSKRRKRSKNE